LIWGHKNVTPVPFDLQQRTVKQIGCGAEFKCILTSNFYFPLYLFLYSFSFLLRFLLKENIFIIVIFVLIFVHFASHCLAEGEVYTWGRNREGQLGVSNVQSSGTPIRVPKINLKKAASKDENILTTFVPIEAIYCGPLAVAAVRGGNILILILILSPSRLFFARLICTFIPFLSSFIVYFYSLQILFGFGERLDQETRNSL
jgi:alpha-tubulin suppressor-like RCC1 family protein